MCAGQCPTIVRRCLREGTNLTQGQVAEEMEWSLSKVMRIEGGDVTIPVSDLRVLLDFLDVRWLSTGAGAPAIRRRDLAIVPGVLQTGAYAEAVIGPDGRGRPTAPRRRPGADASVAGAADRTNAQ